MLSVLLLSVLNFSSYNNVIPILLISATYLTRMVSLDFLGFFYHSKIVFFCEINIELDLT